MNLIGKAQISHILATISAVDGSVAAGYQRVIESLQEVPGFLSLRLTEEKPECGCFELIKDTGKWLVLDVIPDPQGFDLREWSLVASVASGTMGRLFTRTDTDSDVALPTATLSSLILVKDRNGRFLHVNKAFADLYNSDCESMIGKTDVDFNVDQDLFEKYLVDDRKAIDSGEPIYIRNEKNHRSNGDTNCFETVKIPLKNAQGQYDRVLIVATVLNEERIGDLTLGFQNSFLFQMLDNSPNWIIVKDITGKICFVNRAVCEVFGKQKSELIGKKDSDLNPNQEEVAAFQKDDRQVIETRRNKFILAEKTTGYDGVEHWTQTVKKPVIEPNGHCNKVLIVCVPIDEQRKAAAKIRESEQFLREVIDSCPSLIMVKNQAGKILLANQAVANLYGTTITDLVGKFDSDFNSNIEQLENFRRTESAVFGSNRAIKIDSEQVTSHSGHKYWFQTIKKPILSKEDEPQLLVVSANITAQVEANERLVKTKEEAIRASYAKTEFLTRMSHELRTPLNAILGFNQLLQQDQNLLPEQYDTLTIINKSGKHLLNLISDILEMSKVEMGELDLNMTSFNLHKLIQDAVDLFESRATANDCNLTFNIASKVPLFVESDEVKIRQVIMNFVSNAVKFTQDGAVQVLAEATGDTKLRISVIDTGPGIAESEIHQVFGMFRQTGSGRKSEEGAGLGLSISKSLVELLGGEIGLTSKEGVGSNFYFEIPLKVVQGSDGSLGLKPEADDQSGHGYKVLVVDDAPVNRLFVKRLLDRLGYETFEAVNGLEAVESHMRDQPNVILMDVKMPVMDGMTATATIRENEQMYQLNRVPIIALTANAFEEHRRTAAEVGCDGFIAKPFEFAELIDAIVKFRHV